MACGLDYALTNFRACSETLGTTGFEPATYCSQSSRATKLRHVPKLRRTGGALSNIAWVRGWKERQFYRGVALDIMRAAAVLASNG